MPIALFDLPFHARTRSSHFFFSLLAGVAETHFFLEEEGRFFREGDGEEFEPSKYQCVVVFQYSPILWDARLKAHSNVVFVPMLDHVIASGVDKWSQVWRGRKIVSFSHILHKIVSGQGQRSLYLQYFPTVEKSLDTRDKEVFFWERRKEINCSVVATLLQGHAISSITLHRVPDPGHESSAMIPLCRSIPEVLQTEWFASRSDYLRQLARHQVFIAPRPYEGIGMAFLEAMALGLCVIAPDLPTHNEYIRHGENGLLYDLRQPQLERCDFAALGRAAHRSCVEGHARWLEHVADVLAFIFS